MLRLKEAKGFAHSCSQSQQTEQSYKQTLFSSPKAPLPPPAGNEVKTNTRNSQISPGDKNHLPTDCGTWTRTSPASRGDALDPWHFLSELDWCSRYFFVLAGNDKNSFPEIFSSPTWWLSPFWSLGKQETVTAAIACLRFSWSSVGSYPQSRRGTGAQFMWGLCSVLPQTQKHSTVTPGVGKQR